MKDIKEIRVNGRVYSIYSPKNHDELKQVEVSLSERISKLDNNLVQLNNKIDSTEKSLSERIVELNNKLDGEISLIKNWFEGN